MLRRPMGRGLVGTMATTAVVAGTATAVSGRVARRQAGRAAAAAPPPPQSAEPVYAAAPPPPPVAAAPVAPPAPDLVEQLTQLADLKDRGVLTDEEFAAQKARLLGS